MAEAHNIYESQVCKLGHIVRYLRLTAIITGKTVTNLLVRSRPIRCQQGCAFVGN